MVNKSFYSILVNRNLFYNLAKMYKTESERKKRSPNFSYEEKENLLALVAKFQNVLNCKKTGAFYVQKKKEAWVAITKQFNSLCTTGPRDEEMLKHFYNNIKHRARKVASSENKQMKEFSVNSELVSRDDVNDQSDEKMPGEPSLITTTADNKNIKKTGGGSYNLILTDADHQVLAILDDQIRPDEKPLDEAAEYFKDTLQELIVEDPLHSQTNTVPDPKRFFLNDLRSRIKAKKNSKKNECNKCIKKSAEMLKKIYFKKKIELTFYQKKNEIVKFRNEIKKQEFYQERHEIQMQIFKKQLEKVERELM